MNSVLLYGGGIDSYIANFYIREVLQDFPQLVYYKLGHKYEKYEYETIKKHANSVVEYVNSIKLGDTEQSDAFIPNRNLLLAMHAAGKFEASTVYIVGSKSDRVSDNNKEIMDDLSNIISKSLSRRVVVTSPFWNVYKEDMVDWYVKYFGTPTKLLTETFSCYNGNPSRKIVYKDLLLEIENKANIKECLNCPACFRKCAVLFKTGIYVKFENIHIVNRYRKEFSITIEETPRTKNTIKYINRLMDDLDGKKKKE